LAERRLQNINVPSSKNFEEGILRRYDWAALWPSHGFESVPDKSTGLPAMPVLVGKM
jgi:hypothetical protein